MPKKKTAPVEPDLKEINLDEYISKAHDAVEKGKFREAIRLLETVTEMVPEHTEAWNNLGVANLLANRIIGDLQEELHREKAQRLARAARGDYRVLE